MTPPWTTGSIHACGVRLAGPRHLFDALITPLLQSALPMIAPRFTSPVCAPSLLAISAGLTLIVTACFGSAARNAGSRSVPGLLVGTLARASAGPRLPVRQEGSPRAVGDAVNPSPRPSRSNSLVRDLGARQRASTRCSCRCGAAATPGSRRDSNRAPRRWQVVGDVRSARAEH